MKKIKYFDVTHHINKLDEKHGCKLKKPKKITVTREQFNNALIDYHVILTHLVISLNGLRSDKYILKHKYLPLNIKRLFRVTDKVKKKAIYLSNDELDIASVEFKLRYISYFIEYIINDLSYISDYMYRNNKKYKKLDEYTAKSYYIEDIIGLISDYIDRVYNGMDTIGMLLYFNELIYLTSNRKSKITSHNRKKLVKLAGDTDMISNYLSEFKIRNKYDTYGMIIFMAIESIEVGKLNVTEKYIYGLVEDKLSKRDIKSLLTNIAEIIIDSQRLSMNYKMFMDCNPEIISRFNFNNNNKLLIGATSLLFYAFISDDKKIRRKVNLLLKSYYC